MEQGVDECILEFDEFVHISAERSANAQGMRVRATHLSSLCMISKRTSCRVRSRDPMLETRSPSVTSLHDAAARILLPLVFWDMVEYGVFERKDGEDPASNDF